MEDEITQVGWSDEGFGGLDWVEVVNSLLSNRGRKDRDNSRLRKERVREEGERSEREREREGKRTCSRSFVNATWTSSLTFLLSSMLEFSFDLATRMATRVAPIPEDAEETKQPQHISAVNSGLISRETRGEDGRQTEKTREKRRRRRKLTAQSRLVGVQSFLGPYSSLTDETHLSSVSGEPALSTGEEKRRRGREKVSSADLSLLFSFLLRHRVWEKATYSESTPEAISPWSTRSLTAMLKISRNWSSVNEG